MIPLKHLVAAVSVLESGGIIAYPTEAVFGYGCDPYNRAAVLRLLQLKRRPWHKGLILVASDVSQIGPLVEPLSGEHKALLSSRWPGPETWLLPDPNHLVPSWIKGQYSSVAIRVSAHPVVQALCRTWGGPIVSTSANQTGEPPYSSELQLRHHMMARATAQRPDYVVPGTTSGLARPTPIRDLITQQTIRQG